MRAQLGESDGGSGAGVSAGVALTPTYQGIQHIARLLDGAAWHGSRSSGTALVVADPESHAWSIKGQIDVNETRNRMTPALCDMIGWTIVNAIEEHEYRRHITLGSSWKLQQLACFESFPGYTTIRDYLAYEYGAHYLAACRTAWRITERHRESARRLYADRMDRNRGERLWL